MIRRPPRSTLSSSSAASDVYKRQTILTATLPATSERAAVSLAELGYKAVGIDEGWEGCGLGVNSTHHAADGQPIVNASRFDDLGSLVEYGHSKGLEMGWYLNGCMCPETVENSVFYSGDIKSLLGYGFDQVKFDNCGAELNMTRYASLLEGAGSAGTMIENCHWGQCGPVKGDPDGSGCPTLEWCPFNMYRTSIDISSDFTSWLHNLQTLLKFQSLQAPLSVPGCWAYPDMLQVGMVQGGWNWNRAHFGAWAVTSSPLILGADLRNSTLLADILPVISNQEAISVNQAWAGHPGRLVVGTGPEPQEQQLNVVYCPTDPDSPDPDPQQVGWVAPGSGTVGLVRAPGNGCLANDAMVPVVTLDCNQSDPLQLWQYNASSHVLSQPKTSGAGQLCLGYSSWGWWLGIWPVDSQCDGGTQPDPSRQFVFHPNKTLTLTNNSFPAARRCIRASVVPNTGSPVQVWAKPLPNKAVALFGLNSGMYSTGDMQLELSFELLGLDARLAKVRDVWQHADNGTVGERIDITIPALDSVFLVLTPTNSSDLHKHVEDSHILRSPSGVDIL
eukprot:TRINITY_DN26237_c0_g1_i1.p1 TRINITY_DN26237_c0_g1~~TRINITY_DN26237_c0_g1_i1.p1  ORF type:complete len:560 (+),score=92.76 TRINITY_DN26237_c0_g1_i1:54-1733(+)